MKATSADDPGFADQAVATFQRMLAAAGSDIRSHEMVAVTMMMVKMIIDQAPSEAAREQMIAAIRLGFETILSMTEGETP